MKCLLIIDVQVGAFDGIKIPSLVDGDLVLDNIKIMIDYCRMNSWPIIYIQDCGDVGGAFEEGTAHWQIHPKITPSEDDIIIKKRSSNAFEETNLLEVLKSQSITELVVCGLHSEGCVSSSIEAAIIHGFKVAIVSDAHSTIERGKGTPEEIIARVNESFKEKGIEIKAVGEWSN